MPGSEGGSRRTSAQFSPYDLAKAEEDIAALADKEARRIFRETFANTSHGRQCLRMIAMRGGAFAPELHSDRDVHNRNFTMWIMDMAGYELSDGSFLDETLARTQPLTKPKDEDEQTDERA